MLLTFKSVSHLLFPTFMTVIAAATCHKKMHFKKVAIFTFTSDFEPTMTYFATLIIPM